MSFGISSRLLPVRIGPLQGEPFSADLFLRDATDANGEPEGLGSRLNEPQARFLPLSIAGRIEMLQVGAVAYVECTEELPEVERLRELGVHSEPVEVILLSGETLHGWLTVMTPPGDRRLSDLLNHAGGFLLLVRHDRSVYVRSEAVLRVRGRELRGVEDSGRVSAPAPADPA